MKIWPWSTIARLREERDDYAERYLACKRGSEHYQRVLESIPPEVAEEGQRKVSAWYQEQARQMRPSVWI